MLYYLTSINVKLLRKISEDFSQCPYCTAYEYMKTYIEQCPECVDEEKLKWIAETFLGTQKHRKFLRELTSNVANGLSPQDHDYLVTILYAIIFQIPPEEKEHLYKCMFNLSKDLLQRFAAFFSNNEMLPFVSQLACVHYDAKFVTEKIISPLFLWQPYISEICHDFDTYLQRVHGRRTKSPTVPSEMNVLNRPTRARQVSRNPKPATPTFRPSKKTKMLTKSEIDQRLKLISQQNKLRAEQLLNEVKAQNFSFAKDKSNKYYQTITEIRDDIKKSMRPLHVNKKPVITKPPIIVKENVTSLKRMSKTMAKSEKEEIQWMQDILKSCCNTAKIVELEEGERNEKKRERQINTEKNHLLGQLSYEEAILAKQKVTDDNKKKHEEFAKEKDIWIKKIEEWRRIESEKNKKAVEKLSLLELELLEAKNNLNAKKKNVARNVKEKTKDLLARALEEKNDELQRRVNMIKEIKMLGLVAKQAKIPRMLDLTETSGIGLLCEMSIAELQERVAGMKIRLKEELELKKQNIKSGRDNAKQELEETKNMIKHFLEERSSMKSKIAGKNSEVAGFGDVAVKTNKELIELKKTLEEKKKNRQRIAASKALK